MQNLNKDEFEGLLDSIYNDVNKFWRTPIDPSRSTYDTPFWDGNPRFGKPKYQDDVVCLDGKCSPRSAINYIGQGMYSAETGQSPQMAELTVSAWNWLAWGHAPAEDELYWMEYGYKAHQEREKKANQSESKGAPRKRPLTSNALIEAY